MALSKLVPSASTSGKPIKIAASATPGTLFHTADATALDEVWLFLSNSDTVDRLVTVEFGGTASPDNLLKFRVPSGSTILAVPGIPLTGGLTAKAFADAANVVTMAGYVNRIA